MELRIDEARNIAYIKLSGRLGKQDILEAFDAAVSHERYRLGMDRLWDFRDADLSLLDASTIQEMARYSTTFPEGINDVREAFVTSRNLEFGLLRMFEAYSESAEARTTIAVFDAMQDAESWILSSLSPPGVVDEGCAVRRFRPEDGSAPPRGGGVQ